MDEREKALICLTCNKPDCEGDIKCFNERKKELNSERTPKDLKNNCRGTVDKTGDEQVKAVKKR